MQLSSETKEKNESIFFLIFLLKCFQDEKKTQPYANFFFFQITMQNKCKERKRPKKLDFFFSQSKQNSQKMLKETAYIYFLNATHFS
jgi:hypothetical protein